MDKPFIIGIDLGTTNCTMAYIDPSDITHIQQFSIPQIIANATQGEHQSLPSFLYFPLEQELKAKTSAIEWDADRPYCVGIHAKERGSQIPARLIASAKSWLCHLGVNRRDKLLPLDQEELTLKMSPLEACSALLRHLKEAWDQKMPNNPFSKQQILITVPASFDPSARQLIQEAATMAEYPDCVLLEEPQAAFYAWIHRHEKEWRKLLKVGDSVLVVDIGGGTTDYSLINVDEESGDLTLKRVAVGSHLLLGGDNIDFCLAYLAKGKLEELGNYLDDFQFQALVHSCRHAKEALLSDNPPEIIDVTVMGRGSKLIGNTLKTSLTRSEVEQTVISGFFPLVEPEDRSLTERKSGMQQIGLPYAQDARITSQLAKFLSMTGENDEGSMTHFKLPTAVLFNGGTMKAAALRRQVLDVLNHWASKINKEPIKLLTDPDYDYAVSRGAAYYGLARAGNAVRIRSGTSRSYYIGVEEAVPAVPGIPAPLKAVCIAPFGMEEGSELELSNQEFALVVGQQTTFRFFSHSTTSLASGEIPIMGSVVKNWKKELLELHPIETHLENTETEGKTVRVKLKSKITELGVLELWCFSEAHDRQWKLEFDVRS